MYSDDDIFNKLEKLTYLKGLGVLFLEFFKIVIILGFILVVPHYLAGFFIEYDISSGQRITLFIYCLLSLLLTFIHVLIFICFSLYRFWNWANHSY